MDNKIIKEYIMERHNINENKYFINLKNKIDLQKFIESQEGFIYAVDFWSIVLAKMIGKSPTKKERWCFIDNLYDEHGHGNLDNSHTETFKRLIFSLDSITKNKRSDFPSNKYVTNFNKSLKEILEYQNFEYCCAMLGTIEFLYIDVSKNIHNYLTNFLLEENIHHYTLHEILDVSHSDNMFALINLNDNTKQGIDMGFKIMNELYTNLSNYHDN